MITTLILGAGASCAYNYPTGNQLLVKVKQNLAKAGSINAEILKDLNYLSVDSLDEYMANQDEDVGHRIKSAIAEIIHSHEGEGGFDMPSTESPYALFWRAVPVERYKDFRVVTFNYDRSLEYFLSRAIQRLKKCSMAEAHNIRQQLKIIHVHGRLSNLPGEVGFECYGVRDPIKYGETKETLSRLMHDNGVGETHDIKRLVDDQWTWPIARHGREALKTCYENRKVNSAAKTAIEESERVVFLGFGYHEPNMEVLGYPFTNTGDGAKYVYGTCLGMESIQFRRTKNRYPEIFLMKNVTCAQLLTRHVCLDDPSLDEYAGTRRPDVATRT